MSRPSPRRRARYLIQQTQLDLGTGSGAIALALASERPAWRVTGVDRIIEAVTLASANARRLGIANADFQVSDWFAALTDQRFELIVANPPYLAEGHGPEMQSLRVFTLFSNANPTLGRFPMTLSCNMID